MGESACGDKDISSSSAMSELRRDEHENVSASWSPQIDESMRVPNKRRCASRYTHTHTHVHMHTHIYTQTYTYIYIYTHTPMCIPTRTSTHTLKYVYHLQVGHYQQKQRHYHKTPPVVGRRGSGHVGLRNRRQPPLLLCHRYRSHCLAARCAAGNSKSVAAKEPYIHSKRAPNTSKQSPTHINEERHTRNMQVT